MFSLLAVCGDQYSRVHKVISSVHDTPRPAVPYAVCLYITCGIWRSVPDACAYVCIREKTHFLCQPAEACASASVFKIKQNVCWIL